MKAAGSITKSRLLCTSWHHSKRAVHQSEASSQMSDETLRKGSAKARVASCQGRHVANSSLSSGRLRACISTQLGEQSFTPSTHLSASVVFAQILAEVVDKFISCQNRMLRIELPCLNKDLGRNSLFGLRFSKLSTVWRFDLSTGL